MRNPLRKTISFCPIPTTGLSRVLMNWTRKKYAIWMHSTLCSRSGFETRNTHPNSSPPTPRCQYCKNGIPHNRWCVINRVKREGKGYNVNQIHIFHAKLALADNEFQLLLILLKSSSDTDIKQLRSVWIQSMHQEMEKGAETGSTRRSSREWFKSVDIN